MVGSFRGQHPIDDSLRHHTHTFVGNTVMISNLAAPITDFLFLQSLKLPPVSRSILGWDYLSSPDVNRGKPQGRRVPIFPNEMRQNK